MKKTIVLLGIIACSYSSNWNYRNHGTGELTLEEIFLGQQNLGVINLGETGGHLLTSFSDNSQSLDKTGSWSSNINSFHGPVIPVVNHIGIPVITKMPISVPHPIIQTVVQPYPVAVFIPKPVPYQVEKSVFKTVEKKVPTPVEKIIPVKIEKPVPIHVIKHVPIPIEKPVPIKIPVYKTIIHTATKHHKHH